jgi:hypothetical protein
VFPWWGWGTALAEHGVGARGALLRGVARGGAATSLAPFQVRVFST